MRPLASALVASLLTGVYWWIVFTIVYADALFAGDRNPQAQPVPDREVIVRNAVIVLAAIVVYTGLVLLWRRLTRSR